MVSRGKDFNRPVVAAAFLHAWLIKAVSCVSEGERHNSSAASCPWKCVLGVELIHNHLSGLSSNYYYSSLFSFIHFEALLSHRLTGLFCGSLKTYLLSSNRHLDFWVPGGNPWYFCTVLFEVHANVLLQSTVGVKWYQLTLAKRFCRALELEAQQHVERRSLIMSPGLSAVLTYFSHKLTRRSAANTHGQMGPVLNMFTKSSLALLLPLYTGALLEAM